MNNYLLIAISVNIAVQIPLFIFLVPRANYPVYLIFLLLSVAGFLWILFAVLLSYRDFAARNIEKLKKFYRFFYIIYFILAMTIIVYYLDSKIFQQDDVRWFVTSYSYGPYTSRELGFQDGWFSGQINNSLEKRETLGAIGFSFRLNAKSKDPMVLPVLKNATFDIHYSVNKDVVFAAVFEDFNDRGLSYPVICFAPASASHFSIDIAKIRFYNPITTHNPGIKHLKLNYNASLNHFDLVIVRFLHLIGADNIIVNYYFLNVLL